MDRQYVRQRSASASRAFCSSLVALTAERIKLQRVVTNSCGPPAPLWPFFPFTNEHCGCRGFTQAQKESAGPCVGAVFFMRYEISSLQAGIDFAARKTVLRPAEYTKFISV